MAYEEEIENNERRKMKIYIQEINNKYYYYAYYYGEDSYGNIISKLEKLEI